MTGLNAGASRYDLVDPLVLDLLERLEVQVNRTEFWPDATDKHIEGVLEQLVGRSFRPLCLLAGGHMNEADPTAPDGSRRWEPHEIAALGVRIVERARKLDLVDRLLFEIGNEPCLSCPQYQGRPQDVREAIWQSYRALRDAGFDGPIISGGIANFNQRGFGYLRKLLAAPFPGEVWIGMHRYPNGLSPEDPHDGFDSREDEWCELRSIIGPDPKVAITEFGHHLALRRNGFFGLIKKRITLEQQVEHTLWDFRFFRDHGCTLAVFYQLNDGPEDVFEQRGGIWDIDRNLRPVADVFATLVNEQKENA